MVRNPNLLMSSQPVGPVMKVRKSKTSLAQGSGHLQFASGVLQQDIAFELVSADV